MERIRQVSIEHWAKRLRARVERERINFLVEWARKNGVENFQHIYKTALAEFPMAGKQKARRYAELALRELVKTKKMSMQKENVKTLTEKGEE